MPFRCKAFARLNDCANGDEADVFVQTRKTQSPYLHRLYSIDLDSVLVDWEFTQERSQTLNLGWAREEHFLIILLFSPIFTQFFLNLVFRSSCTGEGPGYAIEFTLVFDSRLIKFIVPERLATI